MSTFSKKYITKFIKDYVDFFDAQKSINLNSSDSSSTTLNLFDLSTLLTNNKKYRNFINSTIQQFVYKNELTDKLFELINAHYSSTKSVIDKNKFYNDILLLDSTTVNYLLQSFGFNYLTIPLSVRKRILGILVSAYKNKGSIDSLKKIISSIVYDNFDIKEMYLENQNNNLYFTWVSKVNIPGNNSGIVSKLPYDAVIDAYWRVDKQDILNLEYKKFMSDYIVFERYVNSSSNFYSVAYLKNKAYNDYNILINNPDQYKYTKILNVDSLPETFSYLELWFMIRYFWAKLNNITVLDDTNKSWYYNGESFEYFNVENVYKEQFNIRYSIAYKSIAYIDNNTDNIVKYRNILISEDGAKLYRYSDYRQNPTPIVLHNEVGLLFGKDKNGNPINLLTIIHPEDGLIREIHLDFWLQDFVAYTIDDIIIIENGKDIDGNQVDYIYMIDLQKDKIYRIRDYVPFDLINVDHYVFNHINKKLFLFENDTNNQKLNIFLKVKIDAYPVLYIEIPGYKIEKQVAFSENSLLLVCSDYNNTKKDLVLVDLINKTYTVIDTYDINSDVLLFSYVDYYYIVVDNNNAKTLYLLDHDRNYKVINDISQDEFNFYNPNLSTKSYTMLSSYNYSYMFETNTSGSELIYFVSNIQITETKTEANSDLVDYICVNDSARCFRDYMLERRENELVFNGNILPTFNHIDELEAFLNDLTPANIDEFKKSDVKEMLLFELLLLSANITNNSNMYMLLSYYSYDIIKKLVDIFKPIQSRLRNITTITISSDPIGEWIALADSDKKFLLIQDHDKMSLSEEIMKYITALRKENIILNDEYYIHLYVNLQAHLQHTLATTIETYQDDDITVYDIMNHIYLQNTVSSNAHTYLDDYLLTTAFGNIIVTGPNTSTTATTYVSDSINVQL